MTRSIDIPQLDVEIGSLKRRVSDLERVLRGFLSQRQHIPQGPITDWSYAYTSGISGPYSSGSVHAVDLETEWSTSGTAIVREGADFEIQVAGLYLCSAQIEFAFNGGAGRRTLFFSSSFGLPFGGDPLDDDNEAATGISTDLQFSLPVRIEAGDTMTLGLRQASGSDLNVTGVWGGIALLALI